MQTLDTNSTRVSLNIKKTTVLLRETEILIKNEPFIGCTSCLNGGKPEPIPQMLSKGAQPNQKIHDFLVQNVETLDFLGFRLIRFRLLHTRTVMHSHGRQPPVALVLQSQLTLCALGMRESPSVALLVKPGKAFLCPATCHCVLGAPRLTTSSKHATEGLLASLLGARTLLGAPGIATKVEPPGNSAHGRLQTSQHPNTRSKSSGPDIPNPCGPKFRRRYVPHQTTSPHTRDY